MKLCKQAIESATECGKTCCCCECDQVKTCKNKCENVDFLDEEGCEDLVEVSEETALQTFLQDQKALAVMKQIAETKLQMDALSAKDKEIRQKLTSIMEAYGVKSFDNNILKVTFIAETTSTSIDSARLKKEEPEIAKKYSKTSKKSAYVRIDVK